MALTRPRALRSLQHAAGCHAHSRPYLPTNTLPPPAITHASRYVRALPHAAHFLATPGASAVALWQLLPQETPRNEMFAGWTR